MTTYNDSTFREGQSTIRPPFFDGNDYPYWKTRVRIYLQQYQLARDRERTHTRPPARYVYIDMVALKYKCATQEGG